MELGIAIDINVATVRPHGRCRLLLGKGSAFRQARGRAGIRGGRQKQQLIQSVRTMELVPTEEDLRAIDMVPRHPIFQAGDP